MRRAVLALTSVLFISGTLGSNIGPAFVDDHPLAVLILSSRNRNLFGSVPYIDLPVYAVVGFLRILLAATALYFVGRWYGDRTVTWVENNVGEPPVIYKWMERAVDRAGWLAVYLMPGSNVVCLLVGHRKMSPRTFFAFVIPGIITKLTILWIGCARSLTGSRIISGGWWLACLHSVHCRCVSATRFRPKLLKQT